VIAVYLLVALWALWVAYVATMHIRRVHEAHGLTATQKVMAAPLAVFYLLDIALNWLPGSLVFLDLPVQWDETISQRLYRYRYHLPWSNTRHERAARWIQEDLLADFDPTGKHGEPGRK